MKRRFTCVVGLLASAVAAMALGSPATALAQPSLEDGEWGHYAGSTHGMKYSPLDQITRDNIDRLRVAWRARNPDLDFQDDPILSRVRYQDTALMVNGTLYTVTGLGIVTALDPASGEQRWLYDPESYRIGRPNNGGFLSRGVGYWTDGRRRADSDRHARRLPDFARCAAPASRTRRSERPAGST